MKAKEFAIVEAKMSRKNESVAVSPPKFPDDMPEDEKRAAWNKWLRNQTKKSVDAQRDIQDLANQLRKRKEEKEDAGRESFQVSEVSQDPREIEAADKAIAKILDNPDRSRWDDFTPEEVAEIQKLAKITGRAKKLFWTRKVQGYKVGTVVDLLNQYAREKQRASGQLPDFTGRASTAQDMAKQIALHTDGRYSRLGNRTWSTGYGKRYKDPVDYIGYKDKAAYDDAWTWVQSKGRQVHYRDNFDNLQTAIQIGSYIVEPGSITRAAFSDKPETEHRLSVRSAKSLDQWSRKREEITDQQAAALKDIADTKNANTMDMIKAIMNVLDGEKDVKQIIDQSSKVDPRDKAKLDKIISSAGDFKEGLSEVDMSSPEFQQLLKSVGEKAKQGPKKTVYDPRTGKYKVVPVNNKGSKND